jgi:hypothetical protein
MPTLTRRGDPDAHQEAWRIFYGDIHIGTISMRAGVPGCVDQWGWACGFYPASHSGVRADGNAKSFDEARADFEAAWRQLLPQITKADFDGHRRYRALEAWKHAMWDAGLKLPTQVADGRSRCFCGAAIEIENVEHHVYAAHLMPQERESA